MSARSAHTLSISAARSTARVSSCAASSRANASVASAMRCISSRVSRILLADLLVLDELGAQAQGRDRRAQIVRDRRQHAGAVLDEALQAGMHAVEGAGRLAHVGRPALGHRRHRLAAAEPLGGGRELRHRPGQAAHHEDHDHGQRHRHDPHRDQRRHGPVRVGRRQARADVQPPAVVELRRDHEVGRQARMPPAAIARPLPIAVPHLLPDSSAGAGVGIAHRPDQRPVRLARAPPVAPAAILVAPVDQHLLDPDAGEMAGQDLLQAVVAVRGIGGVDGARIGEPEAQQRRAGGAQDLLVQGRPACPRAAG